MNKIGITLVVGTMVGGLAGQCWDGDCKVPRPLGTPNGQFWNQASTIVTSSGSSLAINTFEDIIVKG